MDGLDFQKGKWQDVPLLMEEVDKLYTRLETKGQPGKWFATKKKIYAERNWVPSTFLIEKNFETALEKLNFFYIPKGWDPGPIFIFPQKDVEGDFTRAQSKPLYEIPNRDGVSSKYRVIGVKKEDFVGPVWLGNDEETLRLILLTKMVLLVEGPFDLLAVRLLCPEIPSLCPLTKKIGIDHQAYLRMLGVDTIYLLFDTDADKFNDSSDVKWNERYTEGAGVVSMKFLQRDITNMEVKPIWIAGAGDPSESLENLTTAKKLQKALRAAILENFEV
jgi:hypothetical protein